MRNWIYRMTEAFSRFMYGRYGFDELTKVAFIAGLIVYTLSGFFHNQALYWISSALLLLSMWRCYSRNIMKRRRELDMYFCVKNKILSPFRLKKRKYQERKTHKYLKCKNCGTNLRVPKGAGKIIVTCPKCKSKREIKA